MIPRKKIVFAVFFLLLGSDFLGVWAEDQIILDGNEISDETIILLHNGVYYLMENIVETKLIVISDNIVLDGNGYTIQGNLASGSKGIEISGSKNVTLRNFRIRSFENGIYLDGSTENIISNNTFQNNEFAIVAERNSGYNVFFMNNFIDEAVRISSHNDWYNGFTGNYWSHIDKEDVFSGPYQSEAGSDGIADRPFYIDEYNIDNYPLMEILPPVNHKSVEEIIGPLITYKLIIVTEGMGTTNPAPGVHIFEKDEVVNITAIPADGWELEKLVLDETNIIQNLTYSVKMSNPRKIEVKFKELPVEKELIDPNVLLVLGVILTIIALWYFIKTIRMNK